MTRLYKLTNQKWQTRGPTQWGYGVEHMASGQMTIRYAGRPDWDTP